MPIRHLGKRGDGEIVYFNMFILFNLLNRLNKLEEGLVLLGYRRKSPLSIYLIVTSKGNFFSLFLIC